MFGENNGKEGKPPRFNLGYKRNSTCEYGKKRTTMLARTALKSMKNILRKFE